MQPPAQRVDPHAGREPTSTDARMHVRAGCCGVRPVVSFRFSNLRAAVRGPERIMAEYSLIKACERLEAADDTLRELVLDEVDARLVRALSRPSCL